MANLCLSQVEYDGTGFLEKNRDSLPSGANELMQASKNPLIELIFKGMTYTCYVCVCVCVCVCVHARACMHACAPMCVSPVSCGQYHTSLNSMQM